MKIAYVGNRNNLASDGKSFNTEAHIALSLEKLGHEILFIQENLIDQSTFVQQVVDAEVDFFLWTRTWKSTDGVGHVSDANLHALKAAGILTVSFHLDKYAGIQRDGGLATDTFWRTDYVFSPEGSYQSKAIFESHQINQRYLPPGVYEGDCYMADPVENFKHDVVFVGGGIDYMHPEWPYRAKLVRWLQETYGDSFGKYGHPERTVRGHELNQLYASSKVVIGDSLCKDFFDSFYYSDRMFEVTGRGGMLISPYIAGVTDHFIDRKEAVFYAYNNFEQLKFMIDYYVQNDYEREHIRLAGHLRTKQDNTYTQRMQSMLNTLSEEGAL